MSFYRRKLPHWQPDGTAIFLTWRLHGSLPAQLQTVQLTEGQRFEALDRHMDLASTGPAWLKHPAIARAVVNTLFLAAHDWQLYELFAWVVMANHVHVLVAPNKPLREITRAVKNTSARAANRILGRTGQPFWQAESYDHSVRSRDEFQRIVRYIESNPVRAGLVDRIEQWRWSSASSYFK